MSIPVPRAAAIFFLALCPAGTTVAGNGLNVIGFGSESEMMGGADVAVARDSNALAINPAGLVQIGRGALDLSISPFYCPDVGHRDSVGNDDESINQTGFIGGGGYAHRMNPDLVAGIGFFVQGGVGFGYEDFDSGFGVRGDISSLFGIVKLVPGAGYRINDQLSVGAGLNLTYATARQKLFPNSSIRNEENPAASFYGSRIDGLRAFGVGYKLGFRFEADEHWTLGFAFGSEVPLDLKDGETKVNYDALGQGRVTYRDTRIDGLVNARDISLGLAFKPNARWLAAVDLTWLDWSSIDQVVTIAKNPEGQTDPALVPASVETRTDILFRDQLVVALGASWQWTEKTSIRAGFNWGRTPARKEHLNPLFAVIAQPHYTLGFEHALGSHSDLGLGVQLQPHRKENYRNASAPFTADAQERNEAVYLSASIGRRW